MSGVGDDKARFSYLDLLANTLTEHEKNLASLIDRLEQICDKLSSLGSMTKSEELTEVGKTPAKEAQETLIYMKLKTSRNVGELTKMLDSLKE